MIKQATVKVIPAQPGWSLVLENFDKPSEVVGVTSPCKVDVVAWALEVVPDDQHRGPDYLRDWRVDVVAVTALGGEKRSDCQVLCDPNGLFYTTDSSVGVPWTEFVNEFIKPYVKT